MYSPNISEEELKNKVANDFFHHKIFNHTRIIGKIDFCISYDDKSLFHQINFLWAEAKKGKAISLVSEYNPNASLYDIKEFFQGRKVSYKDGVAKEGNMCARSLDSVYNDKIANLRYALQSLASKIEPKIYEFGFLR
ncbi:hypothetical protein CQA53_09420 [Helicobacter didelphidarum]|uniref:Uncharacterized protein n=1 Tax=Helicobacter didelphidarum TaxID=2040648 RepID=A0A3D8IAP6_9HELI|nr:hypothetical protein [Helicobacter didelphidarum]RDU62243.1 hypothetical protein CQA53_09420 [Helicobacter didelphidarum]